MCDNLMLGGRPLAIRVALLNQCDRFLARRMCQIKVKIICSFHVLKQSHCLARQCACASRAGR